MVGGGALYGNGWGTRSFDLSSPRSPSPPSTGRLALSTKNVGRPLQGPCPCWHTSAHGYHHDDADRLLPPGAVGPPRDRPPGNGRRSAAPSGGRGPQARDRLIEARLRGRREDRPHGPA